MNNMITIDNIFDNDMYTFLYMSIFRLIKNNSIDMKIVSSTIQMIYEKIMSIMKQDIKMIVDDTSQVN